MSKVYVLQLFLQKIFGLLPLAKHTTDGEKW